MGEVSEAERGAVKMFEAAVDRLGRPVARTGPIEVGQNVLTPLRQGAAELLQPGQGRGDTGGEGPDQPLQALASGGAVLAPVRGDHLLIGSPGDFDRRMLLIGEQGVQPVPLLLRQQVDPGGQGLPCSVERIAFAAPALEGLALDPAPALVEALPGEADDMERIHDRLSGGELFRGGALVAAEPVQRDHLDTLTPLIRAGRQPRLERLLRTPGEHVQQPGRTRAVADAGQIYDHRDVLIAGSGVAPDVLVHAEDPHRLEPGRALDQGAGTLGQDSGVRGVPGHPELLGDPRHTKVLTDQALERPAQPGRGELRPRCGRAREVLPPEVGAVGALVAAQTHQQDRRPPTHGFMGESVSDRATPNALPATAPAPRIGCLEPALDRSVFRFQSLADGREAECVETAERRQIGAAKIGWCTSRFSLWVV